MITPGDEWKLPDSEAVKAEIYNIFERASELLQRDGFHAPVAFIRMENGNTMVMNLTIPFQQGVEGKNLADMVLRALAKETPVVGFFFVVEAYTRQVPKDKPPCTQLLQGGGSLGWMHQQGDPDTKEVLCITASFRGPIDIGLTAEIKRDQRRQITGLGKPEVYERDGGDTNIEAIRFADMFRELEGD